MTFSKSAPKNISLLLLFLGVGESTSSLRRSLRSLSTASTCTRTFSEFAEDIVNEVDLDGNSKNWLVNDRDESFISELFRLYVNEQMISASGAEILDGQANNADNDEFPEVCQRLPLKRDECYFATNDDASFLEKMVAEYVPFGKSIVKAKDFIEDLVDVVDDTIEEVHDFWRPEAEDPGTCIVVNEQMIGIAESPGMLEPWIYDLCNCISTKWAGAPYCPIQPHFTGFALSLADSSALEYDIEEKLDIDSIYDGYTRQSFTPEGDIWAGLDIQFGVGKILPLSAADLICAPSDGGSAAGPKPPVISMETSLLVKAGSGPDEETLILLAISDLTMKFNTFIPEWSLGSAFGALRMDSEDKECRPSGMFATIKMESDWGLGDGIAKFINMPSPEARADFGITWDDDALQDLYSGTGSFDEDTIQSVFVRFEYDGGDSDPFNMMGVDIGSAVVEFQYISEKEFARRQNFDEARCCTGQGIECDTVKSPISEWIEDPAITAQPTVAMFLHIEDFELQWGLLDFKHIKLEFLHQFDLDDFATSFLMDVEVTALYVADLAAMVEFNVRGGGDYVDAAFAVSTDILGVKYWLNGTAEVGDYTLAPSSRELSEQDAITSRRTLSGGDLSDASWDLTFTAEWDAEEWINKIGDGIVDGLKVVYEELEAVWNDIEAFVDDAWNAIKAFGAEIGGAIASVIDQIVDDIPVLGDMVGALKSVLGGEGGDFVSDIINALGSTVVEVVEAAAEVGRAIAKGDWKAVGEAFEGLGDELEDTFGFSPSQKNKSLKWLGTFDDLWNCELVRYEWRECKRAFGIEYDCENKSGNSFANQNCVTAQAEKIADMEEKVADADTMAQCKQMSEDRTHGLKWASGLQSSTELGTQMGVTDLFLGSTSNQAQFASCQTLEYDVAVKELATGFEGATNVMASQQATSSSCLDFSSVDSLEASLEQLQSEVINTATDLSKGDQGVDDDVAGCQQYSFDHGDNPTCTPPEIIDWDPSNPKSAHVTCDVRLVDLNFEEVFGEGYHFMVDESCPEQFPAPRYSLVESTVLEAGFPKLNYGSGATTKMLFNQYVTDCCGQKSDPIQLILYVHPLAPTFTTAEASMDVEVDSLTDAAAIHPDVLGYPEYEQGCRGSITVLDNFDSDPYFDEGINMMVIERTFELIDDGNEGTDMVPTFIQRITAPRPAEAPTPTPTTSDDDGDGEEFFVGLNYNGADKCLVVGANVPTVMTANDPLECATFKQLENGKIKNLYYADENLCITAPVSGSSISFESCTDEAIDDGRQQFTYLEGRHFALSNDINQVMEYNGQMGFHIKTDADEELYVGKLNQVVIV